MRTMTKVNGTEGDALVIGGVVVLSYFLVVKPIMNLLGGNPEDQQTISNQANQAPAENYFSLQYQPFVDNFNANPSFNTDGSRMTMQQFFKIIKANNDDGTPIMLNGVNIAQLGEDLESALSPWVVWTNSTDVISVFSELTNKTQVSSLAAYVYYNYGKDLLSQLQGSIFKTGLSPADLSTLINRLDALPD